MKNFKQLTNNQIEELIDLTIQFFRSSQEKWTIKEFVKTNQQIFNNIEFHLLVNRYSKRYGLRFSQKAIDFLYEVSLLQEKEIVMFVAYVYYIRRKLLKDEEKIITKKELQKLEYHPTKRFYSIFWSTEIDSVH